MAMLYNSAMIERRPINEVHGAAEETLIRAFLDHGWSVKPPHGPGRDLLVSSGGLSYVVEVKSSAEGRADRVIPLLSQAILQASRYAGTSVGRPLAVVRVGRLSKVLRDKVSRFHAEYAPEAAVGLIGADGGMWFEGEGLAEMNMEPPRSHVRRSRSAPRRGHDLFSDLNQWLFKVLLAPELPEALLNAPRREYRTAAGLADAAQVSAMSVSRFIRRLREEALLEENGGGFRLVRRAELFRRWQAAAMRATPELPMRFLLPGASLPKVVSRHTEACVGLFAAATLLGSGHVAEGLPWVYVRKLPEDGWPELVEAAHGEPPQLILKQAAAPESVFRGAVQVQGVQVSDILQVWLDVSSHPARGREQAEHLERTVLADVMGKDA